LNIDILPLSRFPVMVLRVRSCIVTNPIFYKIQIICRGNQNRLSLKRFQEIKKTGFTSVKTRLLIFATIFLSPPNLRDRA
jgi:hypothetical protein